MDMLEFHRVESPQGSEHLTIATKLPGVGGLWLPFPVEYKRGRPKPGRCDEVQLCAQAVCLEEMLGVTITRGAIFYGQPRRRHEVSLDDTLRGETEEMARRMHRLFDSRTTPPAAYASKCENCSLVGQCMPKSTENGQGSAAYLDSIWKELG